MTSIDELLEQVGSWSQQDFKYELKKYQAIRAWALEKAGINYAVGDKVQIKKGYQVRQYLSDGHSNGWWPSRECLIPGALATVHDIDFNACHNYWYADIILDREWSIGNIGKDVQRYWCGPAAETPEGMQAPSKYNSEHYPNGRRHTYSFGAENLEKVASTDNDDRYCPTCGQEKERKKEVYY